MKTSYIFWPCFFTFLIFFNQGFWEHEKQYLELDFQMKKPDPLKSLFFVPSLPPLNLSPLPPNKEAPKTLDPKAGDSAQNNQSNGVSTTPRQS